MGGFINLSLFVASLAIVAVCEPNKLPELGAFPVDRLLKLEDWAGMWKSLALFAKNGSVGGKLNTFCEGSPFPLKR